MGKGTNKSYVLLCPAIYEIGPCSPVIVMPVKVHSEGLLHQLDPLPGVVCVRPLCDLLDEDVGLKILKFFGKLFFHLADGFAEAFGKIQYSGICMIVGGILARLTEYVHDLR